MSLSLVARRHEWRVLAAALQQRGEVQVANVLQAGLAFSASGHDPAASVTLQVPETLVAVVQAVAHDLDLEFVLVDERAAAVAAAEAILRIHHRSDT